VAQVHEARLKSGQEVVIKVRRPGTRRLILQDLGNLRLLARLADRGHKTLAMANPVAIVDDFSRAILEELDLTLEAQNMKRYREILLEGFEFQIDVPEPFLDYCTARVLVMEKVGGIRADDVEGVRAAGIDANECLLRLNRAILRSMMFHGFFHGDLHAGNLRLADGDRVVLMDFGLMGRLTVHERQEVTRLFVALAKRNFRGMADAMLALAEVVGGDPEAFAADLEATMRPIIRSKVGEMNFGQVLQSIIELGGRHRLKLPRALILLLKQLLYVDRFAHLLAPGFNPFKDVRTIDFVWMEALGRELYPDFSHFFSPPE
jgi:predicted unusual protein kinase regulating ubiquinone biosynthesis (AarF/ABC1/UbiB family)